MVEYTAAGGYSLQNEDKGKLEFALHSWPLEVYEVAKLPEVADSRLRQLQEY